MHLSIRDIDEKLVSDLSRATGEKTSAKAICSACSQFLSNRKELAEVRDRLRIEQAKVEKLLSAIMLQRQAEKNLDEALDFANCKNAFALEAEVKPSPKWVVKF